MAPRMRPNIVRPPPELPPPELPPPTNDRTLLSSKMFVQQTSSFIITESSDANHKEKQPSQLKSALGKGRIYGFLLKRPMSKPSPQAHNCKPFHKHKANITQPTMNMYT
eukprot:13008418-Ditylum_brightwellii.AAC.2